MRKHVLMGVARQLSVPEIEAAEALHKFTANAQITEKALKESQDALLVFEAQELAKEDMAAAVFTNRSIQQLQKLARFITEHNPDATALLVANNNDKLQFVAARGVRVTRSMKDISLAVLPIINGKGGGSDALVQGGGKKLVTADVLLAQMKSI